MFNCTPRLEWYAIHIRRGFEGKRHVVHGHRTATMIT